jgi:folate-binding protein YgfZ
MLKEMEPNQSGAAAALAQGRAYADLSRWRKVMVLGSDARTWLNDLLTADIGGLDAGSSRRALLLSPTGRIRAEVTVASMREGLHLFQDPIQPSAIDTLLAPYVLSSDVELVDVSRVKALLAFPGSDPPRVPDAETIRPSCLGRGADLILSPMLGSTAQTLQGLTLAGPDALETWRIDKGIPKFPLDLTPESLPHEADLDEAIDYAKGCYLGQEAVAKVRNLGHPTWVVLSMRSDTPVAPSDSVMSDGNEVGRVTSAATVDGHTAVIARVRWSARQLPLTTGSGTPLQSSGIASTSA